MYYIGQIGTSQVVLVVKEPACQCRRQDMWVWSLGREDALEKEMATHSSILAWRTPWTEEPGELQSIGSQRVGHDWGDLACKHSRTKSKPLLRYILANTRIRASKFCHWSVNYLLREWGREVQSFPIFPASDQILPQTVIDHLQLTCLDSQHCLK